MVRLRRCVPVYLRSAPIFFAVAFAALPARAAKDRYPSFSGYVVDSAHVIDANVAAQITGIASQLDHAGYAQLAVCTLPSLGNETREEAAVDIFKQWQLGHGKERADGILILLVPGPPGHRQIKVEVGYGLEGLLNDGKVGELRDRLAYPLLRQDQYGPAALAMAIALSNLITAAVQSGEEPAPGPNGMHGGIGAGEDQRGNDLGVGPLALAICTMGALLVLLLSTASRRQFPGARTVVVAVVLAGAAVIGLLMLGGGIGSWVAFLLGLGANGLAWASIQNRKCPKCGGWVDSKETVEKKPSIGREGSTRVEEHCTRCDYSKTWHRAIPRTSTPGPSIVGGGGWGGGGGSDWGGGGGGGDSGGGFSGGGGGDSGGGGAGGEV